MNRLTWREAVRIHEERARADRQATPPEDASGMRCLGCGYYDDEPQAQRMCMAGEGAGHAFVRVGPDGCVPVPDDDPATLRARLQERYEPTALGTLDNGEPVRTPPQKVWRIVGGVGAWWWFWPDTDCFGAMVGKHEHPAYPRPERPCTYDPDGDPLWFERARAQLEAPPIEPVLVMSPANAERFTRELAAVCAMPERYDPADEEPEAEPVAIRYPSDMFAPPKDPMPTTTIIDRAILEEVARDLPKSYASVTGWTNQIVEDPSNGPRMDRSVAKFMERVRSAALLRFYLRTLTDPDATAEDVNGALDALTPEDRALVSEALPSWGSARMSRVEAIAPFMARFKTMVRERDPRAQEEGTLILSALLEDDPTRSTVEALMEIAKTPKVNP